METKQDCFDRTESINAELGFMYACPYQDGIYPDECSDASQFKSWVIKIVKNKIDVVDSEKRTLLI